MMMEYAMAAEAVMKVMIEEGSAASFSPNTAVHTSVYVSAPTASPTRAIREKE